MIAENINATKSSGANTNRQGNTDFNVPTAGFLGGLFAKANLSAAGNNKFAATGGASAANTFNGTITVTVTNVLPNGNLVVSGEKQMLINQGNEFVRFSGVVNPNTISARTPSTRRRSPTRRSNTRRRATSTKPRRWAGCSASSSTSRRGDDDAEDASRPPVARVHAAARLAVALAAMACAFGAAPAHANA